MLNFISNKKTAHYKEIIHSSQNDHFGDNLASSNKVGDANTLPTYLQSFSTQVPWKNKPYRKWFKWLFPQSSQGWYKMKNQWYTSKCLTTGWGEWGKKSLSAAFADFCGVNTATRADFKPSNWIQELRDPHTIAFRSKHQSLAPAQQLNHSKFIGQKLKYFKTCKTLLYVVYKYTRMQL